jgi:hypothetical protein
VDDAVGDRASTAVNPRARMRPALAALCLVVQRNNNYVAYITIGRGWLSGRLPALRLKESSESAEFAGALPGHRQVGSVSSVDDWTAAGHRRRGE